MRRTVPTTEVVLAERGEPAWTFARVRQQLLAFGMAVIAMGYLPRLPSKQVTFPHSYGKPPTYADIPVPHTPGELLWRIEELEQTVWQMMSRDLGELVQRRYGPVRRTYGFFETSAWLSIREVERFGIKAAEVEPETVVGDSRCAEHAHSRVASNKRSRLIKTERLTGSDSGRRFVVCLRQLYAGGRS